MCIDWSLTPEADYYKDDGIVPNKNYCRNKEKLVDPDAPDGPKKVEPYIYCWYGKNKGEFEACKPRTIEDVPTTCGLVEPFILGNYEIPISIMNKLRVKRCVGKNQCNKKDLGSNFSITCENIMD